MSIVYILTNESMPGYIKIGRTETSVPQRMSELDKTSMPLPFQCYYAARVDDYAEWKKLCTRPLVTTGSGRVASSSKWTLIRQR